MPDKPKVAIDVLRAIHAMRKWTVTGVWVAENPIEAMLLIHEAKEMNDELREELRRVRDDMVALREATALAVGVERHEWRRVDGTTLKPMELNVSYRFAPESIYALKERSEDLLRTVAKQIGRNIEWKLVEGGWEER